MVFNLNDDDATKAGANEHQRPAPEGPGIGFSLQNPQERHSQS